MKNLPTGKQLQLTTILFFCLIRKQSSFIWRWPFLQNSTLREIRNIWMNQSWRNDPVQFENNRRDTITAEFLSWWSDSSLYKPMSTTQVSEFVQAHYKPLMYSYLDLTVVSRVDYFRKRLVQWEEKLSIFRS